MRWLAGILLVIGGALAAAWLGGETWLAREAARMIADDPRISAAAVTPLREPSRIGLHLADLAVDTPAGPAQLPALDLWAAPTAPTRFHASLPPDMTVPVAGTARRLATTDAGLSVRLSPGSGMAVSHATAQSGPATMDGASLLDGLDLRAALAPLGADAPRAARARYDVALRLDRLMTGTLAPGAPAELAAPLSAAGDATLYLTTPLRDGTEPQLVGFAAPHGVTLTLGERRLRVSGAVGADAAGRAAGALFVYTAQARDWLQLASDLGMIPGGLVQLVGTALDGAAAAEVELPPGITPPAPPADGEIRVPLIFREGRMFLGPLGLGDAPLFSA